MFHTRIFHQLININKNASKKLYQGLKLVMPQNSVKNLFCVRYFFISHTEIVMIYIEQHMVHNGAVITEVREAERESQVLVISTVKNWRSSIGPFLGFFFLNLFCLLLTRTMTFFSIPTHTRYRAVAQTPFTFASQRNTPTLGSFKKSCSEENQEYEPK